jgi:hypothetical protein
MAIARISNRRSSVVRPPPARASISLLVILSSSSRTARERPVIALEVHAAAPDPRDAVKLGGMPTGETSVGMPPCHSGQLGVDRRGTRPAPALGTAK